MTAIRAVHAKRPKRRLGKPPIRPPRRAPSLGAEEKRRAKGPVVLRLKTGRKGRFVAPKRTNRRKGKRPNVRLGTGARASAKVVLVYDQRATPLREWDRGTQFLSTFVISAFVSERTPDGTVLPSRPSSVVLVGNPGSGKTELVERFKRCYWISYHNDLTVRPLLSLLRKAEAGVLTHVGASEFNKYFQRKMSVAEGTIGLLSGAMEEGITQYSVGPTSMRFEAPARLGLIAGCTPGTMSKRREMLAEMGFLSRACVLDWALPRSERDEIMRRMNRGDPSDLEPVDLVTPPNGGRAVITWDATIGEAVASYVKQHWPENDLRTFKRFKALMLARAYLVGHAIVTGDEWDWLKSYDDYWGRMITGDA